MHLTDANIFIFLIFLCIMFEDDRKNVSKILIFYYRVLYFLPMQKSINLKCVKQKCIKKFMKKSFTVFLSKIIDQIIKYITKKKTQTICKQIY